jgi:hypothetical protein
MGRQCRAVSIEEYSLEVQAQAYSKLYDSLRVRTPVAQPAAHGVLTTA